MLHRMYFPEFGEALSCLLPRAICPDAPVGAFANLASGKEKRSEKTALERDERREREARPRGFETPEDSAAIVAESASDSLAQRRAKLRLLAEAHLVGAVASAKPVFATVTELIRGATDSLKRDKERFAHVLGSVAAFAKAYGEAFVREEGDDGEDENDETGAYRLSPEQRGAFRDALRSFHVTASIALLDERRAARDAERETKSALARTGELSESLTLRLAELEKSRESLRKSLEVLTEALGGEARGVRVPPDVDDEKAEDGKPKGDVRLSRGVDAGASRLDAASWDDEATRAFYESLPALRETVPRGLLPPEPPASRETRDGDARGAQPGRLIQPRRDGVAGGGGGGRGGGARAPVGRAAATVTEVRVGTAAVGVGRHVRARERRGHRAARRRETRRASGDGADKKKKATRRAAHRGEAPQGRPAVGAAQVRAPGVGAGQDATGKGCEHGRDGVPRGAHARLRGVCRGHRHQHGGLPQALPAAQERRAAAAGGAGRRASPSRRRRRGNAR